MAGYVELTARGASNTVSFPSNSERVEPSSSDLTKDFTWSLLNLPEDGSDEEKQPYVSKCVQIVAKFLEGFDFTHPEAAQQPLVDCLYLFDNAAEDALYHTEAKWAKSAFRQGYAERITELWTADAAQQFYHILFLSPPQERVAAAQKWTEQFATGTASFKQLAKRCYMDSRYFSSDILSDKTLTAFDTYYHQAMQQKGEQIIKIMEQNLGPSGQDLEAIDIKGKKDPHSLSAVDKEIFECMGYSRFPCFLEEKKTLLKNCLELGKSVESASSITESEESRLAFEQLFAKLDNSLVENLA